MSVSAKANFKRLGKLYGARMKDVAAQIEQFSIDQIRSLESGTTIEILGKELTFEDIEIRRVKHEGVEVETDGELTVALDTTITLQLRQEGSAREFVNRIQNLRKPAALMSVIESKYTSQHQNSSRKQLCHVKSISVRRHLRLRSHQTRIRGTMEKL